AEFENYRKRTEREKWELIEYGNFVLLLKMVSILDLFDEYIKHTKEQREVKVIMDTFKSILSNEGVVQIQTNVGDEFDVNFHEAILKEDSDQSEDTITKVLQYGYTYRDKVLRYVKVAVSNGGNVDE
ncbi:MAG: nucleotide exchange factor GrpE, partial [Firmicutes bacterium]|nr:nucleotide exchange factor GrpE [Bacillota bacterium]